MPKSRKIRFVVVDGGQGRLLESSFTAAGRIHVEELASIRNEVDEVERSRPSPRSGKSGNTYASGGHEDDDRLHRFAKEVATWIESQVARFELDTVPLFSPPRFLGELRKVYGSTLNGKVREWQADLTGLTPAGLAKHPSIEQLMAD